LFHAPRFAFRSAVAAPICRDLLREAQKRDPARKVPDQPFGTTTVAQG